MKRLLSLLIAATMACPFIMAQARTVTVTPTNPRIYSRFIYNYRSVLRDFEIDPDITDFISTTGAKCYPAFLVKCNDGFVYAVSAADVVAFADKIDVTIADSVSKISYQDLQVININEKLNLAVTRMPKSVNVEALDIDSVWFSDESEQYSVSARMFLKSVPMEISGDAASVSTLYNRLAVSAPEGYYYILPNLSYKYLYTKTVDQIADGIDSLSESDYQLFRKLNADGEMIAAMRILAGDMAARRMKRNLVCTNTIVKENSVTIEGKGGEQITFAKEFGAWRITADTKPQAAATTNTATYTTAIDNASASAPSTSVIDNYLIGTTIMGKVQVPYNFCDQGVSGSISIGYTFKYLTLDAVFLFNSLGVYKTRNYDPYYFNGVAYNSDYRYSSFIGLGVRIGGAVPILLTEKLTISPHIAFEWDVPYMCSNIYYSVNSLSPLVGANLYMRMGKSGNRFFVGVEYEHRFFIDYQSLRLKNRNMGYINANIGFVF